MLQKSMEWEKNKWITKFAVTYFVIPTYSFLTNVMFSYQPDNYADTRVVSEQLLHSTWKLI